MALTPWLDPGVVAAYLNTVRVRARRAVRGHRRHPGDARAIIRACIEACWDGRWFRASPGHFDTFWTRDLSFSVPALVQLGEQERVHASLARALDVWTRRRSHVTTTIHYFDRPGDVFEYGIDSLPLLLAALRSAGADDLVERHRGWLEAEVAYFVERVVDPGTGLARADRTYSGHRDTVVNRSTAYGNTMIALLGKTLAETGWAAPLADRLGADPGRLLVRYLWDDDHFRDAVDDPVASGEANVWPFFTGVVAGQAYLAPAMRYLAGHGYADPYPLRYELVRRPEREVPVTRLILPDYQGSTAWTSLGSIYLQLLRLVDPAAARDGIARHAELVERDGTFWEVLDERGRCWVSPTRLFIGEESMLWSAIFLDLLEHPDASPAYLSPPALDPGPSAGG